MIAGELNLSLDRVETASPGTWHRWAEMALQRHLEREIAMGLPVKDAEEIRDSYLTGTDYSARQMARRAGQTFLKQIK